MSAGSKRARLARVGKQLDDLESNVDAVNKSLDEVWQCPAFLEIQKESHHEEEKVSDAVSV